MHAAGKPNPQEGPPGAELTGRVGVLIPYACRAMESLVACLRVVASALEAGSWNRRPCFQTAAKIEA
jgi:hypothetical protein